VIFSVPAMTRLSAGVLLYRRAGGPVEVLLVHPGGPFWAKRDAGAWSIPKGEYDEGADPVAAARREFLEETGHDPPAGDWISLGSARQKGGKVVVAWAVEGDLDVAAASSNTFSMEWPPKSGRLQEFPEVDRWGWFDLPAARAKILPGQAEFLDRLAEQLRPTTPSPSPRS
jgi:predicted NUDIX family NTP pyrophosphohydrolase